jgi:hypothetical protein
MDHALTTRMSNQVRVREDLNRIRDYVKDELFYRTLFIYSDAMLEEGSVLHKDFIANCKPKLADGTLETAPADAVTVYLKYLWTLMVKDKCYREWLGLKRSNAYQAVQDKFVSKCCSADCSMLSPDANPYSSGSPIIIQRCVKTVRRTMRYYHQ